MVCFYIYYGKRLYIYKDKLDMIKWLFEIDDNGELINKYHILTAAMFKSELLNYGIAINGRDRILIILRFKCKELKITKEVMGVVDEINIVPKWFNNMEVEVKLSVKKTKPDDSLDSDPNLRD